MMRPTANFLSSPAFVVAVFPFGAFSAKSAICRFKRMFQAADAGVHAF